MTQFAVGDRRFSITASEREGRWIAEAIGDDGVRFGVECGGASAAEAIARVIAWLEWQHEHERALDALKRAEQQYHRTIAGSAFANPSEGPTPLELQKESLGAVEAARVRLDEIRARKPQ